MNSGPVSEKLHTAVIEAAVGTQPLRARLIGLFERHLVHIDADSEFADAETAAWFKRIVHRLSHDGLGRPATGVASLVHPMSDEEVEEFLIEIVCLYDETVRNEATRERRRERAG